MSHRARTLLLLTLTASAIARAAPWPEAPAAAHSRDPARLSGAVERIGELPGVQGVLVAHRGELVVERYFRGAAGDRPHNMKSASKSVLSALTGIAIEEGLLRLDQPIAEILPRSHALSDPAKRAITVHHLLTMTSGLEPTSYDTYNEWIRSHDWVESALARPLVAEPGTFYQYSTGSTHILSAVLAAASGMSTREYAERKLFAPIGARIMGWQQDPAGVYVGGNNLSLLPRDMLRFGQLYLDGGRFGEHQVLPVDWVEQSTRTGESGLHIIYGTYRYLWWTDLFYRGAFTAVGYGGQYIYVSPPHDTVVVVISTLESKGLEWTRRLFAQLRNGVLASFEPSPTYYASQGRPPVDPALDSLTQALAATEEQLSRLRRELAAAAPAAARGRTTSRVNLREKPDTASRRLTVLERGIAFDVLEHSEAWLRVRTADHQGWLHSDYARLEEETTWRASLAPLGAELASFVGAARRALKDSREVPGEADPAGDDQVPLRLDGPDPVFAAEEGEVARLSGRAGEFAPQTPSDTAPAETRPAAAPPTAPRLSELEASLTLALTELEVTRRRIAELEGQTRADAAAARRRSDELIAQVAEAEDRATASEARTARAQSSALAAAGERDRLAEDLSAQRQARGAAEQALEGAARAHEEERARLTAELETARRQAAELGDLLQSERESLVATDGERTRLMAELQAARERLSGELTERQLDSAALDALEQESARLAADLEEARQSRGLANRQLQRLRREAEEVAAGLEAQVQTARTQGTELAEQLQAARRLLEETDGERQRLTTDLSATRDRMNAEVRAERARVAESEQRLAESEERWTAAQGLAGELTEERDQLKRELASAREALLAAESSGEASSQRSSETAARLDAAQRDLASAREENRSLTGQLEAESGRYEAALSAAAGETESLRGELDAAHREIAESREARATAQKAQGEASDATEGLADELAKSEERAALAETEGRRLAQALHESELRWLEASDALAAAEVERSRLARALAEAEGLRGDLETRLQRQNDASAAERLELRQSITALEARASELNRELAAAGREIAAAKSIPAPETALPEERISVLEAALDGSEEISRQQARELDGLRRELVAQGSELADAAADRTRLKEELAAERGEKARLEARVEELERAIVAARPAPPPRPDASGVPGGRQSVNAFVRTWGEALSRRDLDRFLSLYSRRFQPPRGLDLHTWGERRVAELADPTVRGLELGGVEIAPDGSGGASARFVYRLLTSERAITLTKTLSLIWESGGWKIVREAPLLG